MAQSTPYLVIAALVLGIAGCKKEAPPPPPPPPPPPKVEAPAPVPVAGVSVGTVTLGSAIGADKKVTKPGDTFAKGDTIYAAVETAGSGSAQLKAKWTYHKGDKTAPVDESTETINATGPATTAFRIAKPSGWPPGDYSVEIFLGDKSTGVKKFTVK